VVLTGASVWSKAGRSGAACGRWQSTPTQAVSISWYAGGAGRAGRCAAAGRLVEMCHDWVRRGELSVGQDIAFVMITWGLPVGTDGGGLSLPGRLRP
jgi:hypothetical protein